MLHWGAKMANEESTTLQNILAAGKEEFLEKQLRKLAAKYYPTKDEIEKEMNSPSANRVEMICIKPDHMTGKLVNEK